MVGTSEIGGRDPGTNATVLVVSWIFTTIALSTIALRFYVRRSILKSIMSDDWFMFIAGLCQIAFQICLTKSAAYRLRDPDEWRPEEMLDVMKWAWIGGIPGGLAATFARISITILLVRIFGSKAWLKWYLIVWTMLLCIFSITTIISFTVQARPIDQLWDPAVPAAYFNISIIFAFITQLGFTISDLTYVLFPSIVVWNLNMTRTKKLGIFLMLALSLVTMAVSIVKVIKYINSHAVVWASIEQSLVILMGNVPALRPLTKTAFPRVRQWLALNFDATRWTINTEKSDEQGLKKEYAGT